MGSVGFVGLGARAPGRLSLRCSSVGVDAVVGAALRRRVLAADDAACGTTRTRIFCGARPGFGRLVHPAAVSSDCQTHRDAVHLTPLPRQPAKIGT